MRVLTNEKFHFILRVSTMLRTRWILFYRNVVAARLTLMIVDSGMSRDSKA